MNLPFLPKFSSSGLVDSLSEDQKCDRS